VFCLLCCLNPFVWSLLQQPYCAAMKSILSHIQTSCSMSVSFEFCRNVRMFNVYEVLNFRFYSLACDLVGSPSYRENWLAENHLRIGTVLFLLRGRANTNIWPTLSAELRRVREQNPLRKETPEYLENCPRPVGTTGARSLPHHYISPIDVDP
jgi:hypothetical protein